MRLRVETSSPEQTEAIGYVLADCLAPGTLIALFGDLATGKTCLVRGMARRRAGEGAVHSPTFTLVNQYGEEYPLYHLDLYRLGGPEMLADLGYEEVFDGGGLCAVEWAERAGDLLPADRLNIYLAHAGGDRRTVEIEAVGLALPVDLADRIQSVLAAAGG